MRTVNVHDAKTHLSRLLAQAAAGEEIVIANAGTPIAKLVPLAAKQPRILGLLRGKVRIEGDFDAPLPEAVAAGFEG
jgi:prevent-host-death family protein